MRDGSRNAAGKYRLVAWRRCAATVSVPVSKLVPGVDEGQTSNLPWINGFDESRIAGSTPVSAANYWGSHGTTGVSLQ